MKKETNIRLTAIQKHIERNFLRWVKTYSNVEGVHAGFKTQKGRIIKNKYTIVFHVFEKKEKPKKMIPPYMVVQVGRKKIKIYTDVITTKKLELNGIKIGDKTKNTVTTIEGTISFYFSSAAGIYLCSNMHVLAPHFIRKKRFHYDVRNGDPQQQIELFNDTILASAELVVAQFGGVDLGFARIDDPQVPQVIERVFKNVGPVKGVFELTNSNFQKVNASFVGSISGHRPSTITALRAFKQTAFPGIFLTNLVKLERSTLDGDSGAALIDDKNRLLGIIIGRDEDASYAMHLNDVMDFFQNSNL